MKNSLIIAFFAFALNTQAQISPDYTTIKLNNDIELLIDKHSTLTLRQGGVEDYYIRIQTKDSIYGIDLYYNQCKVIKSFFFGTSGINHPLHIGYHFTLSPVEIRRPNNNGIVNRIVVNKKVRTKTKGKLVLRYKIKNKIKEIAIPMKHLYTWTDLGTPPMDDPNR